MRLKSGITAYLILCLIFLKELPSIITAMPKPPHKPSRTDIRTLIRLPDWLILYSWLINSIPSNLMKRLIFILLFYACLQHSAECLAQSNDFSMTLSKSFYMTGDALDDLYINVTINKGTVTENQEIELVKKSNPAERISGTIYRIDNTSFNRIKTGKAGQEVILYEE